MKYIKTFKLILESISTEEMLTKIEDLKYLVEDEGITFDITDSTPVYLKTAPNMADYSEITMNFKKTGVGDGSNDFLDHLNDGWDEERQDYDPATHHQEWNPTPEKISEPEWKQLLEKDFMLEFIDRIKEIAEENHYSFVNLYEVIRSMFGTFQLSRYPAIMRKKKRKTRNLNEFMNGTALGITPDNGPDQVKNTSQIPDRLGDSYNKLTLNDIIVYLNKQRNPGLGPECDVQKDGNTTSITLSIENHNVEVIRSMEKDNRWRFSVLIDSEPVECDAEIGKRIFLLLDVPGSIGPIYKNKPQTKNKLGKFEAFDFNRMSKEISPLPVEIYKIKKDDPLVDIKRFINFYQKVPYEQMIKDCNSVISTLTRNSTQFLADLKSANRYHRRKHSFAFPEEVDTYRFIYRGMKEKGSIIHESMSQPGRLQPYDKWNPIQSYWQDDINYFTKRSYKKRNPVDTSKELHKTLDTAFEDKFGVPLRSESIFGGFDGYFMADTYGYPFLLFPVGDYQVYWSKKVADLFCYIRDHGKFNGRDSRNGLTDRTISQIVNSYQEGKLSSVINHYNELMIHCDKYIAVNNMFRVPIEWYLRGRLDEFYQKLKKLKSEVS